MKKIIPLFLLSALLFPALSLKAGTKEENVLADRALTRGQFAAILQRFCQYVLVEKGDAGIQIRFPSAKQSAIASGRDFYVIGDFTRTSFIPDNAYLEIQVTDTTTWNPQRTVYTDIKDNRNLYLDYPGLQILDGKEYFEECMMPDLVYDPEKPASWRDTWNYIQSF